MKLRFMMTLMVSILSMSAFSQWDTLNDYVGLSRGNIKYYFYSGARSLEDLDKFNSIMYESSKVRANAIRTVKLNFKKAVQKLEKETSKYENRHPNNKNLKLFFDSLINASENIAADQLKIISQIEPLINELIKAYQTKVNKVVTLEEDMQDIYWRGERNYSKVIETNLDKVKELLLFVMMKDGDFTYYERMDDLAVFSMFLNSHRGFMRERMGKYMKNLPLILKYRKEIIDQNYHLMGRHAKSLPPIMFNLKVDSSCEDGKSLASRVLWENLNISVHDGVFRFNNVKISTVMDEVAAIMQNDSVNVVCNEVWLDSSISTEYSKRNNTIYFNYKYKPVRGCPDGNCRSPYLFSKGMKLK